MTPLHSLHKSTSFKNHLHIKSRIKNPLLKVALMALGITGLWLSYEAVRIYQENNRHETAPSAVRHLYGYGRIVKVGAEGPFYHATRSEVAVKAILQEGCVKAVNHEEAFVSQKWERNYGDYVFVFKDTLRTHKDGSARGYATLMNNNERAWIGFCRKIPTSDRYLAGIILGLPDDCTFDEAEILRADLELKATRWAGRPILVEHEYRLKKLKAEMLS